MPDPIRLRVTVRVRLTAFAALLVLAGAAGGAATLWSWPALVLAGDALAMLAWLAHHRGGRRPVPAPAVAPVRRRPA